MTDATFLILIAGGIAAAFLAVRAPRFGDLTGWLIGLGHGALAVVALAGLLKASDSGFATGMALLGIYAGAMTIGELVHRLRQAARPALG